jgi:LPS-assembly protein
MTSLRVAPRGEGRTDDIPALPAVCMLRFISTLTLVAAILSIAAHALAQTPQSEVAGCRVSELQGGVQEALTKETEGKTERIVVITGVGALPVRVDCDDTQFFAEYVEIFQDRNRVVATRNVTAVSPSARISAERMEFDTKMKTGVFYNADGIASLGDRVDRSMFGTQEPDAMFRGREIHKIGPKKYRIVGGAFTTCVQPTPRWELVSGSATLNLDDYALLKNSVFRVKNVPLFYLPMFYYPIQEDDRATGFLIPTYGTSTFRGQSLSNAFFWAISRSQDATFLHDWFSKAGQQVGGEYRYVAAPGSTGSLRTSFIDEEAQAAADGGAVTDPGREYRVEGGMTQTLGGRWRARANANFFSNAGTEQLYQQDVYRATQSTRTFGGNISGGFREFMLSGTVDRIDYLNTSGTSTSITTTGSLPRINFSRAERRMGKSPLYFGLNSDYVSIIRSQSLDDVTQSDSGLSRIEVTPTVRIPFTKVPFFTVNSTVGWRGTYWTESLEGSAQVPESLKRQYFDFNSRITGPVFMRIFNPPREGATKFKHVIEPSFSIRRVTPFDVYPQIVKLESSDYEVPNTTRLSYGLTNRLYAKKESSREVLNVSILQSYYSNEEAALYDPQYQTGFSGRPRSKYGPVVLQARTSPADAFQTDFKTEWDHASTTFQSFAANGLVNGANVQATGGWSQLRTPPDPLTPGAVTVTNSHYLNASVTVRQATNRVGGTYMFNYDLLRDSFLQQRYFAYYNAQCCGFLVEYQTFNFTAGRIPQDRRFNVSFTLAGIGTFSNFLGAFGGGLGGGQTGR